MFTLKIKWMRFEEGKVAKVVDETTLFIPADRVLVHGEITSLESMSAWEDGSFMNYAIVNECTKEILPSRLIAVEQGEKTIWYLLATQAWVLGPTGSTIERVAP